MVKNDGDLVNRFKQPNVLVIGILLLLLLLFSFFSPQILESSYLANRFKPFINASGRVCIFLLYAMTLIPLVNYVYYGVLRLSRRNFYSDHQRDKLVEVLRDPQARADIHVFRAKTKNLTEDRNVLAEIIAAIIPNALKQQFMLEQYFKAKIDNYMNRFTGTLNTISMVSNLGPIVGFLGTLLGLILAFAVSADAIRTEGQMSPDTFGELQYSMMIAIMTSVYGVVIKIISSVIRQALLSKIDKISDEITAIPIDSMYEE